MLLLVALTGSAGLLTSVGLLRLHLDIRPLRYVISVTVAYGAFLVLVWLWTSYQRRRWHRITHAGGARQTIGAGIGGTDWIQGDEESNNWSDGLDWLDLLTEGEWTYVVLVVAGALSIIFVTWGLVSLIAFAPEFIAEVLLDGVFSAALVHRLGRIEHRHWLKAAFARTRGLFLWTLLFFAFVGVVSRHHAPDAISIGGVVRHMTTPVR